MTKLLLSALSNVHNLQGVPFCSVLCFGTEMDLSYLCPSLYSNLQCMVKNLQISEPLCGQLIHLWCSDAPPRATLASLDCCLSVLHSKRIPRFHLLMLQPGNSLDTTLGQFSAQITFYYFQRSLDFLVCYLMFYKPISIYLYF